mgnify:CR=1 FL=1
MVDEVVKEKEGLGVLVGIICFILPFVGIILGLVWIKKPYGKTALLLGIAGAVLGITSRIIVGS